MALSHGKIILVGEHSVVYNKPAIAIPFFKVITEVNIFENDKFIIESAHGISTDNNLLNEHEGIYKIYSYFCNKYLKEMKRAIKIVINSSIPISGGLGSSAAVSKAVTLELCAFFDVKISEKELFKIVEIGEKVHHLNPSGIDAKTIIYEKPILFYKKRRTKQININFDGYLVVADSGLKSRTLEAVSLVKQYKEANEYKFKKLLNEFTKVTKMAKKALVSNDFNLFKKAIINNQLLLEEIGVGDLKIKELINVATTHGASAAKLTGGGIGGSMIALTKNDSIAVSISEALINAGATNAYIINMRDFNEKN